ncbi:MAG: type II toxin-antitoxin system VapC family toxin [Acidobacteriota bacterium]
MNYLVDTNVVSELRNPPRAHANVVKWQASIDPAVLFLSAISLLELEHGTRLMERRDARQGKLLRQWLDKKALPSFEGRILPITTEIAVQCAALLVPDPRPLRDALIAATALVHGMTVVTRNVSDFKPTGVNVFNPWAS